jgi:two-component system phosphate regulon sensor histidine kinase PhoR
MPLTLAGLFVLVLLVNQFIREFYYSETKKDLKDRVELIGNFIENIYDQHSIQTFAIESGNAANMRVTIIDSSGLVLGDSHENPIDMDNHGTRPEVMDAIQHGNGNTIRYSQTIGENLMYYAIPISPDRTPHVIRVSVSLNSLDDTIQALQNKIIFFGFAVAFGLLLLSYLFSRKIARPLEDMKSAAEQFSKEDLSKPVIVPNTKELASLAESLNAMASNLSNRLKTITDERNEREAILSSMREGVVAIGPNRAIISINDTACDYLEINKELAIGQPVDGLIRDSGFVHVINRLLESKNTIETEIRIKRNKDRFFWVKGNTLTLASSADSILVVMNDMTHQKQLEKIRQDFVANVSHELKTPITSMIGYMEILDSGTATPEQSKGFIEKVFNQTKRLNAIVDDLLKLSRIEAQEEGEMIELIHQPLFPILSSAVEDVKSLYPLEDKKIELNCSSENHVNADAQLLREAISNLLDNAIKYGFEKSSIQLSGDSDENQVMINVTNGGNPIPEKYKKRIFQRFYRIDKSRSRDAGGTGLGLAIVKHIVFVHGGKVLVENFPEAKTRFKIILPA